VLYQKDYVNRLKQWFKYFSVYYFEFIYLEDKEYEEIDMEKYMKWDDWWVQFEELKNLIDKQNEKCL